VVEQAEGKGEVAEGHPTDRIPEKNGVQMPLYVTEAQVAELLTPADARAAVHASFERLARGVLDNPPRVRAELPGGVFAVMPCVDRELGYAGLKTYAWLPGGTPFLVVLFSIERAELAAIVEADLLGQRRTAAASAVGAQLLARNDATTLGVIGCGRQAAAHVVALREALPALERVLVFCPNEPRLAAFCLEHGCEAAEGYRNAGECDVVVTATTSKDPVLRGEWLRDGALVLAIGLVVSLGAAAFALFGRGFFPAPRTVATPIDAGSGPSDWAPPGRTDEEGDTQLGESQRPEAGEIDVGQVLPRDEVETNADQDQPEDPPTAP